MDRADLHELVDRLPEESFGQVHGVLTAWLDPRRKGRMEASRASGSVFARFPPPVPFGEFRSGSKGCSSLGEGDRRVEEWEVRALQDDQLIVDRQLRLRGHDFRNAERWVFSEDGRRITLDEGIVGPGHGSSRSVVFEVR